MKEKKSSASSASFPMHHHSVHVSTLLQKIGCEKAFYFPIMICWVPRDAYSSSQFPILHHFYPCHHHQPQGSHPHHHHRDLFSRQGSHILLTYSPDCTSLTLSDAYYLALIPTFLNATKNGAANF